jgi:hypothetical protein
MKNNPRSRSHRIALLLLAIFLLACTCPVPFFPSSLPIEGNGPEKISFRSSPDLLTDPTTGLASLKSYHVSFHQDVTGSLDGQPFERHTHIELTRASGQSDFVRELQGTDESASYFRAITTNQAVYRWNTLDESCQGEVGELLSGETLEPAELLLPILQTSKVGTETVNQIPLVHYHFDQNALPLTEPKPSVTGEIWLAEQGGYLVKYSLNAAKPAETTGAGLEAAQSWTYELSQINAVESVTLPAGCMAVPVDIPVMPDATDVSRSSGMMEYSTASSIFDVVDFYYHNLDSPGWTTTQKEPTGELKVPLGLSFSKGDERLSINIDQADAGGLEINIVLYNPKEQALATTPTTTTPEGTSTPAVPQPTIDPSMSGLPADVPLYPGATNLTNLGGQGISFDAPDLPDQVAAFYHQQMAAAGWSPINEAKSGTIIIQIWKKEGLMVSLQIDVKDGKTNVLLMLTNTQ